MEKNLNKKIINNNLLCPKYKPNALPWTLCPHP
jgi:hypothetical protein